MNGRVSSVGYRDRSERLKILAMAASLLTVAVALSLAVGPTGISFQSLPRALSAALGHSNDAEAMRERLVLFDIRLPRTLLGVFVGAALAVAGATMQSLFRNPLADPGLIGVSAGAALAAVATIALGHSVMGFWVTTFGLFALPLAAFFGGLVTTTILVALASRDGSTNVAVLLLAGVAIAALAMSGIGFISYLSDDRQLRDITLWQMGSLSGASWHKVWAVLPFAATAFGFASLLRQPLNGLLLGESEAFHLGIDVERAKRLAITMTALAVGAAVAVAGVIGFVGLVVPHLVRLLAGPDNRIVLPASAILGATLLVFADVIARMIISPAELPIGIVMAAIGAPIFLHLLLRRAGGLS